MELAQGVYSISEPHHWEDAHCFVFVGSECAILIDSGTGIQNIKPVVDEITSLPVTVLTTHAHWDHYGNHDRFEDVHVHKDDAEWIRTGLPVPVDALRATVAREPFSANGFDIDSWSPPLIPDVNVFCDQTIFRNGTHEIVAVHTPGHSPGSTCFFDTTTGYLATGDTLYEGTIYANYPGTDPEALITSLEGLMELDVKAILPGHNKEIEGRGLLARSVELGRYLRDKKLVHHGSGLHSSDGLSFLF
jgi:glyoxylase-like metal-dependent hydrolase (beta-lactamase superfamily II)